MTTMPDISGVAVEDGHVILEDVCLQCEMPFFVTIPVDDWDGNKVIKEKICIHCAKDNLISSQSVVIEDQKLIIDRLNALIIAAKHVTKKAEQDEDGNPS